MTTASPTWCRRRRLAGRAFRVFGRINGREGLRACCHVKTVVTDKLPIHLPMSLYPIRAATFPMLEGAVRLLLWKRVFRAGPGVVQVARSFGRMAKTARSDK